jgi:hypothetical protein
MKSRRKRFQILWVMGISFWILLFPAYLHYTNLEESDFLSGTAIWENPDQDGSPGAQKEKKAKLFASIHFSTIPVVEMILSDPLQSFSFPRPLPGKKTLVFRC